MTVEHLPATTSTLRAQGWAHPRPGLSIDDLIPVMESIGNTVLEVHRDCDCVGAGHPDLPIDERPTRDDHLLVLDKEVTQ